MDLKQLVDELRQRKIQPPILIRVMDILEDRLKHLALCFQKAFTDAEYQNKYIPLFPIKVNQQRQVVESILHFGAPFHIGLEAGSKAELLAVLALTQDLNTPLVCNGYKDEEFVEMVGLAHKMGKKIIPIIEKYSEIETFIKHYKATGIMPQLGVRLKISHKGTGQWANSGGDRSKFGLRIYEIVQLVERLKEEGLIHHLKLLHFHIGSQITQIRVVKEALTEVARVFGELVQLGVPLEILDVGGGLGVDYDGSSHETFTTINYTIEEYANDVVYRIQQVCDRLEIPHPIIFSESGRFLSAHYSFLITNIAAVNHLDIPDNLTLPEDIAEKEIQPIQELWEIYQDQRTSKANILEHYHDANQARQEIGNLFNLGYISLNERSFAEKLFLHIMLEVQKWVEARDIAPVELENLDIGFSDTYFANFSLFQSLPDSWAINQIFPVMPIHRLQEEPTRRGVVVDLTCDSDGTIKTYLGQEEHSPYVWLHRTDQEQPYYIGFFLIGAYQEILGELHNLFGDTHAVQIRLLDNDRYQIASVVKGDMVEDVLKYVSYHPGELVSAMRGQLERAIDSGHMNLEESAFFMDKFEEGLKGYTYFEDV
jgi:arginine decarboxylase